MDVSGGWLRYTPEQVFITFKPGDGKMQMLKVVLWHMWTCVRVFRVCVSVERDFLFLLRNNINLDKLSLQTYSWTIRIKLALWGIKSV